MKQTNSNRQKGQSIGLLVVLFALTILTGNAIAKSGILIVAHGSPAQTWNHRVLRVGAETDSLREVRANSRFEGIKIAFLEFAEPRISQQLREFQEEGYDQVVVMPLLIAPSQHSQLDLLTLLGLYSEPKQAATVEAEGGGIYRGKLSLIVGPTLEHSNLLELSALDRVYELSSNPGEEALVILAHGDRQTGPVRNDLCRRVGAHICGKTGITWFDWALVEMGQSFYSEGLSTIYRAGEARPAVLVIGLYLSVGVDRLASRWGQLTLHGDDQPRRPLQGLNVKFSRRGVLPDSRVSAWILNQVEAMLNDND